MRRPSLGVLLMASPLVALGIDFALSSFLLSSSSAVQRISAPELLSARRLHLGRYREHPGFVSRGDLRHSPYYPELAGRRPGLVISHFLADGAEASRAGSLGRALVDRLWEESPRASRALERAMRFSPDRRPGEVVAVDLDLSERSRAEFPIASVFVALLPEGEAFATGGEVTGAVASALRLAEGAGLDALIVPCLAVRPGAGRGEFADFFDAALEALAQAPSKVAIEFSLWAAWETPTLEAAVAGLDERWAEGLRREGPSSACVYAPRRRLTLLFLPICLLTCSLAIAMDARRVIAVAIAFLVLVKTLQGLVSYFIPELGPSTLLAVDVAIFAVSAVLFPTVSSLARPKLDELFPPSRQGPRP